MLITTRLQEDAPEFDGVEWPEPSDGDKDENPLFDSQRGYLEQLPRYKASKASPRMARANDAPPPPRRSKLSSASGGDDERRERRRARKREAMRKWRRNVREGKRIAPAPYNVDVIKYMVATDWLDRTHADDPSKVSETYFLMIKDAAKRFLRI